MKNFISIDDISDFNSLIDESISIKKNPFKYSHLGEKKAIGLIFFKGTDFDPPRARVIPSIFILFLIFIN